MLVIGQHKLMQNSIHETMHTYEFKVLKTFGTTLEHINMTNPIIELLKINGINCSMWSAITTNNLPNIWKTDKNICLRSHTCIPTYSELYLLFPFLYKHMTITTILRLNYQNSTRHRKYI